MRGVRVEHARALIGPPPRVRVRLGGGHLPPVHLHTLHRVEARGRAGHRAHARRRRTRTRGVRPPE